jgi:hypothetical protein
MNQGFQGHHKLNSSDSNRKWGNNALWRCVCDCGKEVVVTAAKLREGSKQSCGCLARERSAQRMREKPLAFKHGQSGSKEKASPTYMSWRAMCQCCLNPNAVQIVIPNAPYLSRWAGKDGFTNFLADLGVDNDFSADDGVIHPAYPLFHQYR